MPNAAAGASVPDTLPPPRDLSPAELAALGASEPPLPADLAAAFDAASAEAPAESAVVIVTAPPVEVVPAAEGMAEPGEGGSSTVVSVVSSDGEGGGSAVVVAAGEGAAAMAGAETGGGGGASRSAALASGGGAAMAVAGGLQLTENVGPSSAVYKRAPSLKADKALVKLLIPEARLTELWDEIAELEVDAAHLERGSQLLVTEMIDRLASARNMLLHSKDRYENALREVTYVRYRLTRIQHSSLLEQPQSILAYLVIILVAVVIGFFSTPRLMAVLNGVGITTGVAPSTPLIGFGDLIAGMDALALFNTAFWGALGGLAAAFFALQRHVEDFDQQHARWYYLSPLVGLFVGPLMGLVAGLGLPALFQLVNEQPANMEVRPALLYLLAWTVGYQQNLLLELIRSVLKRVLPAPADETPKSDPPIR